MSFRFLIQGFMARSLFRPYKRSGCPSGFPFLLWFLVLMPSRSRYSTIENTQANVSFRLPKVDASTIVASVCAGRLILDLVLNTLRQLFALLVRQGILPVASAPGTLVRTFVHPLGGRFPTAFGHGPPPTSSTPKRKVGVPYLTESPYPGR